MRFMNDYDITRAQRLYADHDVLGPAVETIANLRDWTNANSDGWCYWPKPCRAAAKIMELIERDGTNRYHGGERTDATVEEYRKALRALKAFRTRQGADFVIVEPTLDTASSASRQHYIDTGRYLTASEVAEYA